MAKLGNLDPIEKSTRVETVKGVGPVTIHESGSVIPNADVDKRDAAITSRAGDIPSKPSNK